MTELDAKPICSEKSKNSEPQHLYTSAHAFFSSDISHIHIVIDSSENTHGKKSKERQIRFISIPEGIMEAKTKWFLERLYRNSENDHYGSYNKYYPPSERRSSLFMNMKSMKHDRFTSTRCLCTNLFTESEMF